MLATLPEKADAVASVVPVGVAGALIVGVPLQDWIVVGTALLLLCNLGFAVHRIYRGIRQERAD